MSIRPSWKSGFRKAQDLLTVCCRRCAIDFSRPISRLACARPIYVKLKRRSVQPPIAGDTAFAPPSSRDDERWEAHAARVTSAGPTATGTLPSSALGTSRLPFSSDVPEFRPFPAQSPLANYSSSHSLPVAGMANAQPLSGSPSTPVGSPWNPNRLLDGDRDVGSHDAGLAVDDHPTAADGAVPSGSAPGLTSPRLDAGHAAPAHSHLVFQIHNRYLITQDGTRNGGR